MQVIDRVDRADTETLALHIVQQAPPVYRPTAVNGPHVMRLASPQKGLGEIVETGVKNLYRFVYTGQLHLVPPGHAGR
jgi:hypothetical protein